jgi:predicted RNA binding protein YcfA (HicA-like mRNA interferase family)
VKLPRDLTGAALVKALSTLGYETVRQNGSHIRMKSWQTGAEHLVTVPNHRPMRVGTLNSILVEIALFRGWTRDEVVRRLNL